MNILPGCAPKRAMTSSSSPIPELEYRDNYEAAERAAIAHADDFYDHGGFGDASNDFSGMIFYLDMVNCILIITTTGEMIDIISDARLADLFDIVYEASVRRRLLRRGIQYTRAGERVYRRRPRSRSYRRCWPGRC